MLSDTESSHVYEALSKFVRERGLDWILEQVAEQVRFGMEEKKSVRVGRDDVWPETPDEPRSRRSKVLFAATRPFTEQEKLRLLIDAIQQAVVNTTEMEASFREGLGTLEVPRAGMLVREELNPKFIEISESPQVERRAGAQKLATLLGELREEV